MKITINGTDKSVGGTNEGSIAFNYRSVVELAGKKVKDKPTVTYFSGSGTGQLFHNCEGVRIKATEQAIFNVTCTNHA
jgi:hypothetical protein